MSICIDRAQNIIINQGGKAHHTGWVLINIVNEQSGKVVGKAITKGRGVFGANTHGIKVSTSGRAIPVQLPLTKDQFIQRTGWKPEA